MPRISQFYGITILMFFGDHDLLIFTPATAGIGLVSQWLGSCWRVIYPTVRDALSDNGLACTRASWRRAGSERQGTRCRVPLIRSPERLCMVDITTVEVLRDRVVRLSFSDETERVVDLQPFLWGPAFGRIASDDDYFRLVRVDPEVGTIVWPNGADLDPDVLHGNHEPVWGTRSKSNS